MSSTAAVLRSHVDLLVPAGMSSQITKRVSFRAVAKVSYSRMLFDLSTLGFKCETDEHDSIPIRELSFDASHPSYMTRCMPFLKSKYLLSLRKRNLKMDEAEGFVLCDAANRTQNVMSTVNAAYFLQDRCAACGAELDCEKNHAHSCAFFCIAACEQEHTSAVRMVVVYVEFNIRAALRTEQTASVPCVSLHVLSPSHLLSACLGVVDALALLLETCSPCVGALPTGNVELPCPTMIFRDMLRVDVTCLYSLIAFYIKTAVPREWAADKKAAIARILLAVGEYALRTCVRKPMIVPFVPASAEAPDTRRHCVWVPMRQMVETLQGSKLRVPPACDIYERSIATMSVPLHVHDEKRDFLCFLSGFGVEDKALRDVFCHWTSDRVLGSASTDLQRFLHARTHGQGNTKLEALLYAVRCFFYENQQTYFREELVIPNVLCLSRDHFLEVEMRFLLLLFRKCVSRQTIYFDTNDICDVICLAE